MKTAMLAFSIALTLPAALAAGEMESLRSSSFGVDAGPDARSAVSVPAPAGEPVPVLEAISDFFRLLFTPDGGVEIANPVTDAPRVDGELEDEAAGDPAADQVYEPLDAASLEASRGGDLKAVSVQASQVPQDLMRKAQDYFLANSGRITNKDFMGIIDFSQHSSRPRFYILGMRDGSVKAIRVAHGRGSDPDHDGFATVFSNTPNSNASSLGFYLTGETYIGKHGKSMRLHGLSSTNSNALSRAVVIHEASYVQEANVKQGRSFGCPAVAASEIADVISSLRGGALIYGGLANSGF
ncbi:MAG: murein L,D-transpeptidase catalytic domain family protein [Elusimicrobiales bacterium]|nr:murein L,D-transpeptidase catalytic domain family protein [Elusimicrobiales bacterium]